MAVGIIFCFAERIAALVYRWRSCRNSSHHHLTNDHMMLVWLISVFFVAGLACWLAQFVNTAICKWIALLAALVNFILSCSLFYQFRNVTGTAGNWLIDINAAWIPFFGVQFHLALDGLSLVLLLL